MHFSPCGGYLATGGDDKRVKLWSTTDWNCYRTCELAKKVTAVCVTSDSKTVLASDKFGEVVTINGGKDGEEAKSEFLLGHMSLITSMVLAKGDEYVITADRDEHIRVSYFPDAYDIHSVCLGHKVFVTALALHPVHDHIVISGDGSGSLRAWDYVKATQTSEASIKDGAAEVKSEVAVLALAACGKSSVVGVVCEGIKSVFLYAVSKEGGLTYKSVLSTSRYPSSLLFDSDGTLLVSSNAHRSTDRAIVPHVEAFVSKDGLLTPTTNSGIDGINEGLLEEEVVTGSVFGKGVTQGELHKVYHDQSTKRPKHNYEITESKKAANAAEATA